MKQIFTFLFFCCIMLFVVSAINSCANIIPPSGGLKDTIPPFLVAALPKDSATNVTTQKIVLTFDEYVEVKDAQQQLIVSPVPKNSPLIDSKLRNITIKLRDSLEPNTTYSLDFGNSVKDVNEGNIAKNFTYVFSTGKYIDNNTFSGKVILAETGKVDSTLIVVLHKNLNDTSIIKNNPRYYAKVNGKGFFTFYHLPAETFNAYVLENGYSKKYDDSTKPFAFLNKPVVINDSTTNVIFYAYNEVKKKEKSNQNGSTTSLPPAKGSKADNRLRYIVSFENGQQDLLSNLEMTFTRKLKSIDTSKILLTDTLNRPLKNYTFSVDSTKTKISINYKWKEETAYRLLVAKDAVADTNNVNLLKADTVKFITKREVDYGSLHIRFRNMDLAKNPVLQLIQQDKIVESIPLTTKEFNRKLIKPGDYELHILFDENKNGIWDAGNYKLKKQPEIVQQIPKKILVKANWENDVDIVDKL